MYAIEYLKYSRNYIPYDLKSSRELPLVIHSPDTTSTLTTTVVTPTNNRQLVPRETQLVSFREETQHLITQSENRQLDTLRNFRKDMIQMKEKSFQGLQEEMRKNSIDNESRLTKIETSLDKMMNLLLGQQSPSRPNAVLQYQVTPPTIAQENQQGYPIGTNNHEPATAMTPIILDTTVPPALDRGNTP